MRLIDNWKYKYIEKCLYSFNDLKKSDKVTERYMVLAIEQALQYFNGTVHELMIKEFYFNVDYYRKRKNLTNSGQHLEICNNVIHVDVSNGYVIRREIIYRIAMNCYASGVFKV